MIQPEIEDILRLPLPETLDDENLDVLGLFDTGVVLDWAFEILEEILLHNVRAQHQLYRTSDHYICVIDPGLPDTEYCPGREPNTFWCCQKNPFTGEYTGFNWWGILLINMRDRWNFTPTGVPTYTLLPFRPDPYAAFRITHDQAEAEPESEPRPAGGASHDGPDGDPLTSWVKSTVEVGNRNEAVIPRTETTKPRSQRGDFYEAYY